MADNIALVRPGAGQTSTRQVGPNARLEFTFNQDAANLSKEGQDLVFTFADGGKLVLEDFYDNFGDNAQPPTLVVHGMELPGEVFLASFDEPDLMPASGPAGAVVMVGGGVYDDALLYGVQSVSRLEKLTFDGAAPELRGVDGVASMGSLVFGRPSAGLDEPSSPTVPADLLAPPPVEPPVVPPVEPPVVPPYQPSYNDYVARGIFYNSGLEVDLLSVDYGAGKAEKAVSLPGSVSFEFYDAKGNSISDPCTAVYDPLTGRIAFGTLAEEGIYYCVITDDTGNKYSMQLVSDLDGSFDSHVQDKDTPPLGAHLWYGEWHAGQGGKAAYDRGLGEYVFDGGVYNINTSSGDDNISIIEVRNHGGNETVYGMGNSAVNTGNGSDTISINVEVNTGSAIGLLHTDIDTGDGDDSIGINVANSGRGSVTVTGARGNDSISAISTGEGDDAITINAAANANAGDNGYGYAYAYGVGFYDIDSGAGDDSIFIDATAITNANGLTYAYGVHGASAISAGDGDNSININAAATTSGDAYAGAAAYGFDWNNRIATGKGGAAITINAAANAAANGTADSFVKGVHYSSIAIGEGDASIDITATAKAAGSGVSATAYGMDRDSSVEKTGKGDVSIDITATAATTGRADSKGGARAYGLSEGSGIKKTGEGDANIDITATAARTGDATGVSVVEAYGMRWSSRIETGEGDDNIRIKATAIGGVDDKSEAYGMGYGGRIVTGKGDDSIRIEATADGKSGIAAGMSGAAIWANSYDDNGNIIRTDGNTTIDITAAAKGGVDAYGMQSSSITAGDGDNNISISATGGKNNYAMDNNSSISAGAGDDTVSLTGGMRNSSISTGDGSDHVSIDGNVSGRAGTDKIDLGDGDDHLMITGNVSGMILDGGANATVVQASGDNHLAHLGDILGLGGNAAHNAFVNGGNSAASIFNGNNDIKNFESLLIDLQDDNSDTLNLDTLLARISDLNSNGKNEVQSVIIKGDDDDFLNLNGIYLDSGAQVKIAGMDGDFYHYLVNQNGQEVHLYLQNIQVTT